jgi:hypothetical protein
MTATLTVTANAQQVSNPEVREYLQRPTGIDGWVDASSLYNELLEVAELADPSELIALINLESQETFWMHALAVLGATGDERAADALIAFVERPYPSDQPLSVTRHEARKEAIRSLGFLSSRTGSERALDYLIESLNDGIWRRRNIQGLVAYMNTYEDYDRQLSIYAIFGLAVSGHPRAGEALRSLQQSPTTEQAQFRTGLDDTLDTWLEIYDVAAERGVAGMYEHYDAERRLEAERQMEEARRLREIQRR